MMKRWRFVTNWQGSWSVLAIIFGASLLLVSHHVSVNAQEHPVDQERELKMKITAPFTVAVVGDLLSEHPVAQITDPEVQGALNIIRGADVGFANMEANIADYLHYVGPIVRTTGPKEIAADVKAMGFKIVNRANNHTTEGGTDGMFETDHWLEEAGIVHAGDGRNLDEARAARYYESGKGRIGLVGMYAMSTAGGGGEGAATYKLGDAGGSPGLNPLHLTMWQIVTQEELDALRKIRDAAYAHRTDVTNPVPPIPANEPKDRLRLLRVGEGFKVGTTPGNLSYTMNPEDLREILRSIRDGKELSDYMIATIHTHEGVSALQLDSVSEYPTDFLVELAHKTIDNGADVFVGHGVHVLRGIEIYKGKPIFYGLSSFVFQLNQQTVPIERYADEKLNPFTTEMTDAEVLWKYWDAQRLDGRSMMSQDNMDSVVAECRYDGGRLLEVRLHPIDLGYGAPLSDKGIPRLASPENAQRILQHLQTISKPFNTTIRIEDNIGVINVASTVRQGG